MREESYCPACEGRHRAHTCEKVIEREQGMNRSNPKKGVESKSGRSANSKEQDEQSGPQQFITTEGARTGICTTHTQRRSGHAERERAGAARGARPPTRGVSPPAAGAAREITTTSARSPERSRAVGEGTTTTPPPERERAGAARRCVSSPPNVSPDDTRTPPDDDRRRRRRRRRRRPHGRR